MGDPPTPTTLRMRDPDPIPFTLRTDFSQPLTFMQLQQAINQFNFQLPQTTLSFAQPVSRLQANGMIKLIELNLPYQGDAIADVVARSSIAWVHDKGLQLKPEIETNIHLLEFTWGQLSVYGTGRLMFQSAGPSLTGSFEGGLQIRWQGRVKQGQVKRRQ